MLFSITKVHLEPSQTSTEFWSDGALLQKWLTAKKR